MNRIKTLVCTLLLLGGLAWTSEAAAADGPKSRFGKQTSFSAIAADGSKYIAAGQTGTCDALGECDINRIVVVRFNGNGRIDRSFGSEGAAVIPAAAGSKHVNGLVVRSDGSVVVSYRPLPSDVGGAGLIALSNDGELDPSFGSGGQVLFPQSTLASGLGSPHALALAPGNRLILAEASGPAGPSQLTLAAFDAFGALDPGFGEGGLSRVDLGPYVLESEAQAVEVQPDGSIVALARTRQTGSPELAVVGMEADGSPLESFGDNGQTILPRRPGANPRGPSGQSIARIEGRGFMIAPASGDCSFMALRSLDEAGNYPGDLFVPGADDTIDVCLGIRDALPISDNAILVSGVVYGGIDQVTSIPVATLYTPVTNGAGFGRRPIRTLSPRNFFGSAGAIATQDGRAAVAGTLSVDRCSRAYKPGDDCLVGAVYFVKPDGRRDRDRGQEGVAVFPPEKLCTSRKRPACR